MKGLTKWRYNIRNRNKTGRNEKATEYTALPVINVNEIAVIGFKKYQHK